MRNMQEQQLEKASFEFTIPQDVIFAEQQERPPVPDVFYDEGSGRFGYFDCTVCDNRGILSERDENGYWISRECQCMAGRRNLLRIRKSGLGRLVERCTFERYETGEQWQAHARERAMAYLHSEDDRWLYFAGQPGCGKTHLCTAVCSALIEQGKDVLYVLWRELVHELLGLQYRPEEYRTRMEQLRQVEVLYIDDFLKIMDKNAAGRELTIAFEVINARYNMDKRTIISTELFDTELLALDQALGSRMIERAKGNIIQIQRGTDRNFRLRE